jgi:leader peptidase (prepilin peptidase)/N-methyltransferase
MVSEPFFLAFTGVLVAVGIEGFLQHRTTRMALVAAARPQPLEIIGLPAGGGAATGNRGFRAVSASIALAALIGYAAGLGTSPTEAWMGALLGWAMQLIAIVDWREQIIPDVLSLPVLLLGLVRAGLDGPAALEAAMISVLVAGAGALALRIAYRRLRGREGLGLGDVKLLAAGAAWLGWQCLPWVMLIASVAALLAALVAARGVRLQPDTRIPFGSYLGCAIWLLWLVRC